SPLPAEWRTRPRTRRRSPSGRPSYELLGLLEQPLARVQRRVVDDAFEQRRKDLADAGSLAKPERDQIAPVDREIRGAMRRVARLLDGVQPLGVRVVDGGDPQARNIERSLLA